MENTGVRAINVQISNVLLDCVMPYIHQEDRDAVSRVCKQWYEKDRETRKHVTIAMSYSTTPTRLDQRFPHLQSLKLKGKPRVSMFDYVPKNWGGSVTPWVEKMKDRGHFASLNSLHLRRMEVSDDDLRILAEWRSQTLCSLKLDDCTGFTTDGLKLICHSCKNLRVLSMEESTIKENDGEWLKELARNNTVLESLNFYSTGIDKVEVQDLEILAQSCPNLVSVKIMGWELLELAKFFRSASSLEEFCGGHYKNGLEDYAAAISLPPNLRRLGLGFLEKEEQLEFVYPYADQLKELDLRYVGLDTQGHCKLIRKCPNLEVIVANYVIGDSGLAELARCCKQLRRIRIEQCGDYDEITDEGVVTQEGLISISQGCAKLEYIAVHVYDITNAALRQIGANLKHLRDFRLRLLPNKTNITDLPIDDGVGALLEGCENLRRLALYLRPGGLTDAGLRYIGRHSPNVRWLLLGNVEVTDEGLLILSNGCPMLQKLEIRKCKLLSEHALAQAATRFAAETGSFRYMWVQDYKEPSSGRHLLSMRPQDRWNVELIPSFITVDLDQAGQLIPVDHAAQVLLYRSFAGRRADCPKNIKTSN